VVENNKFRLPLGISREFCTIRISREELPGSYAARNKGLSVTQSDIVAFTDSDCIPRYDWLEKGVQGLLANPSCGFLGGKIEFFFKVTNRPNGIELFDSIFGLQQEYFIKKYHFASTANLFIHRKILDAVGPFDASLESGGDVDWGNRVERGGYKAIYAGDVVVQHPARSSFRQLYVKYSRVARGKFIMESKKYGHPMSLSRKSIAIFLDELYNIMRERRIQGYCRRATCLVLFVFVKSVWLKEAVKGFASAIFKGFP
jgi:GT2 family glycosyltransferase